MFITFEGPEGAGKSTAIQDVTSRLRAHGIDVVTTREPGAGDFGTAVRNLLLHGDGMPAASELFLFLADRAHNVGSVVRPALERGSWVLCDRYADSTFVYQARVRGLDAEFVRGANAFATGGLIPDLTFLLDLDPEVGLSRLTTFTTLQPDVDPGVGPERIRRINRLDAEPLAFHRAVRAGFLELAHAEPARWRIIDAAAPPKDVADRIMALLPL